MTDNIDTLTGPELSAAVAIEVMGWTLWESCQWIEANGDCWGDADDWNPHIDRNHTHFVLKRCEALGIAPQAYTWIYLATKRRRPRRIGLALLTIEPAIICRAALRAVRESR